MRVLLIATVASLFVNATTHAQEKSQPQIDHTDLTFFLDANGNPQPIRNVDDWQLRREQIIQGMEQAMGSLPDRSQLPDVSMTLREEIQGDGFRRQTIDIPSGDGDTIPADLYFPDPLPEVSTVPGILVLHPTGALGKRIVAGEGPRPNRQYAVELVQRGYVVIAPDYPSFGEYQEYDFNADRYVSGTMKGVFNHMRCVDLLTSLKQVDAERIGVIGHSLGGHNAMFVAAFDQRIDVVVSSCGWTPFHDYYNGNIKGWTSDRYMPLLRDRYDLDPDQVPFDFYEILGTLAPRPFFSSSPKEDANFDVKGVKKAIPRALGVYALFDAEEHLQVRYPDCDHDFPTETRVESYQFIDQALEHTPTREIDFAAELPRIAGKTPAEALQSFEVAPGFRIEQTAAEPFVVDPVAMSFDEDGRLYVVEMIDYSEQETERLGRVRRLSDRDGDGKFDQSIVFASDLSWPTAIICSQGGVFVGAAPEIYFLKDHDGDGKADERRTVFTGFERTNVQGLLNSFRWGPDQRIHGATSSSGGLVRRVDDPDDPGLNLRRQDFSFDPITLDLRAESGGAQHGMSFDDWGRKFVCSNSDHAQMVMYEDRDIARNSALKAPGPRTRIADDGGQAPVFRISPIEPWRIVRTRLRVSGHVRGPIEGGGRPAGYFTGATGVTVFRGDAWGEDQLDTLIVGDVGSNIVHRKTVTPSETTFVASRIDENSEFVRSSDVWFRPVQFANGPDGCLHILDMYRETIEHPKSLPPEIKQYLDLTSGRDRGRLYRIVPQSGVRERSVKLGDLSNQELIELLDHPNGWHRDTASRLLYERQDREIIDDLVMRTHAAKTPQGKVLALSILESYHSLSLEVLKNLLGDGHPRVREVAVRVARRHSDVAQLSDVLQGLANDPDPRVRYELAFTAGELSPPQKISILTTLLKSDGDDPWLMLAALSSLSDGITEVFDQLLADEEFLAGDESTVVLSQLLDQLCRQEQIADSLAAIESLSNLPNEQAPLRSKLLKVALAAQPKLSAKLTSGPLKTLVNEIAANARRSAFDPGAQTSDRLQAIRDLTFSSNENDTQRLLELLAEQNTSEIQSAVIETAAAQEYESTVKSIIGNWRRFSPAVRLRAEEVLFAQPNGIKSTLASLEQNVLQLSDISRARIEAVSKSKNDTLRDRAQRLLSATHRPSREDVISQYRPALSLSGNPGRGRAVFLKNCSTCHQLNGEGIEIGPNLATMKNRGAETILLNVLDPNREVNPQFVNYVVAMQSGKTHTGIIAEETATQVTLLRAERKTDTLPRSDIEEMISTGLSIMPEGLEKEITVEQMADLISYLLSIQ